MTPIDYDAIMGLINEPYEMLDGWKKERKLSSVALNGSLTLAAVAQC